METTETTTTTTCTNTVGKPPAYTAVVEYDFTGAVDATNLGFVRAKSKAELAKKLASDDIKTIVAVFKGKQVYFKLERKVAFQA